MEKDFIITSLQPWDIEIGSTIKSTALEISKTNKVLFINTPIEYATLLKGNKNSKENIKRLEAIHKKGVCIRKINKNLWIADCPFIAFPVNSMPTKALFNFFNRINNKKIARYILKVTKELDFHSYIHIIDTDIYRSLYQKELTSPSLSIYYKRDHITDGKYFKKYGKAAEEELASKSDIVITNSLYFANQFRHINAHTYDLETGVDLDTYDYYKKWDIPQDLSRIKRPIIGYVGALKVSRLDLDLIYFICQQRPQYSFVFIGPEDEIFQRHEIHQLKNVFFLGQKQIKDLPAYMYGLDIATNPQKINNITIGNYPLKIDEYMAMGRPVVATKTDTMQDIFSKYANLPTTKEEFLLAIDKELSESNDKEKEIARVAFAHTHSWENSVKKIYRYIQDYYSKKK